MPIDFDRLLLEGQAEVEARRRADEDMLIRQAYDLREKLARALAQTFGSEFAAGLEVTMPRWQVEQRVSPVDSDVEAAYTWRGYTFVLMFDPAGHWNTAANPRHGYRMAVEIGGQRRTVGARPFGAPRGSEANQHSNLRQLALAMAGCIAEIERANAAIEAVRHV